MEWVSVWDKLPDHDDVYIVTDEYQNVKALRFWTDKNVWSYSVGKVVAWQKMPEPYRKSC